jgi:hypothetical protein
MQYSLSNLTPLVHSCCLQLLLRFGGRLERLRVEGCPRLTDHGLRALGTCTRLQVRSCLFVHRYIDR